MKILFVCSSNVCRSPYAEYVFRRMVEQSPVLSAAGIEVSSSAVFNKSKEIFPKAVVSLQREGFDKDYILSHKPSFKWCDMKRFKDADVIIGMSKMHKWLTPLAYRKNFSRFRKRRKESTSLCPTLSFTSRRKSTTRL